MLVHSREEIKNYIDTADAKVLYALKTVIEAYEARNEENPISKIENVKDLPVEIQSKIEKGRKDFEEGRVYTHKEVMDEVKQKYGL